MRILALPLLVLCLIGCKRPSPADAPPDGSAVAQVGSAMQSSASKIPAPLSSPSASQRSDDPPEAVKARRRLVKKIETFDRPWGGGEWDPRVLDAMRGVPRHLFMPGVPIPIAYNDYPYEIGHEQTISQPTIVALMTNALKLSGNERVLEIGTGSGYQAAVLSPLAKHIYSIEIIEPLGLAATKRLRLLGYHNVTVRIGDGYLGWPERAPFDRIILTAAPTKMPAALVGQLKSGGVIVAPLGDVEQELVRWTKTTKGELVKQRLGGVRFVPMVPTP